jgi:hypothetical protein
MSITEMDRARHAIERGHILLALQQDYREVMTSVRSLVGAIDLIGYPMTVKELEFHLVRLADGGYIRIWRAGDVPGYRRDRSMEERASRIVFARLLPPGLQLIDGDIAADPGVRF